MRLQDAEYLAQKYTALVLKRTGLTPRTLVCPREKSDMTPCVARDGALAVTLDGDQNPICVGCETSIIRQVEQEESRSMPAPQFPAAICLDCGMPYEHFPIDLLLPRSQWLDIHPEEHGVLCARCLITRCAKVPGSTAVRAVIEIAPRGRDERVLLRLRALRDAVASLWGDVEDCEDCADIADKEDRPCKLHGSDGLFAALIGADELLGPCRCGHARSAHNTEDDTRCRECATCNGFTLPEVR